MPPRRLHVVCDHLPGPPHILLTTSTTLYALLEELTTVLPLPDDAQPSALHFLDPRSGGWASPSGDLRDLPGEAHCRVFATRPPHPAASAALCAAAVAALLAPLPPHAASDVRAALREARIVALAAPDGWKTSAAFERLKDKIAEHTGGRATGGGGGKKVFAQIDRDREDSAVWAGSTQGFQPDTASATPAKSRPPLGAGSPERLPHIAASGSRPTSAPPATEGNGRVAGRLKAAAPSPSRTPLSQKGDDRVTLYFVYAGTTTQHAKALVTTRNAIDYESIMTMLRAKFHSDLSLGYMDEQGTAMEIQCTSDITNLLPSTRSTLTLQCWVHAPASPSLNNSRAISPNTSLRAVSPTKAVGMMGSRIGSAGSRPRSTSPQHGVSIPPFLALRSPDVSGVLYTQDQLRELFDELDVDGSGYLDKKELLLYFRTRFDTMGIVDAEERFARELNGCREMADGRVTFNEFAVIMLRIAQW